MPLSPEQIAGCWRQEYEKAPATLARMSEINTLAAAFNANVDSVVKISGAELQRRIRQTGMTLAELKNDADRSIRRPEDVPNFRHGSFSNATTCFPSTRTARSNRLTPSTGRTRKPRFTGS